MEENYLTLMRAVLIQAIKDAGHPQYRREVGSFLKSAFFYMLWQELTEDEIGWPTAEEVRQMIVSGQIVVRRSAYHATQGAYAVLRERRVATPPAFSRRIVVTGEPLSLVS